MSTHNFKYGKQPDKSGRRLFRLAQDMGVPKERVATEVIEQKLKDLKYENELGTLGEKQSQWVVNLDEFYARRHYLTPDQLRVLLDIHSQVFE